MKRTLTVLVTLGLVSSMVSCSSRGKAPPRTTPPPVKAIAIVAGDLLSAAVSGELYDQGFRTFEVPATQDVAWNSLQALAARGVDAVLTVKSRKGIDAYPDNATVRVISTYTGQPVADFRWTNPAVRKNVKDSAREVVRTVLEKVPRPPARP
jgi:hypothetical protein